MEGERIGLIWLHCGGEWRGNITFKVRSLEYGMWKKDWGKCFGFRWFFFIHGKRSLVFMANFSEDFAWIKFSFSFEVRGRGDFFLRECQAFWEGLKELDDNKQ